MPCPSLIGLSFCYWVLIVLLYSEHKSLIRYRICKYFLLFHALSSTFFFSFYPHPRTFFFHCFREKGREVRDREGGGERERNIDVREKHRCVAFSHAPRPGIKPATWVCAMTRNWTCKLSVYWTMLQPTKPHLQGCLSLSSQCHLRHKNFQFWLSPIYPFFLCMLYFWCLRKLCQIQGHEDFFLCFLPSRSFISYI